MDRKKLVGGLVDVSSVRPGEFFLAEGFIYEKENNSCGIKHQIIIGRTITKTDQKASGFYVYSEIKDNIFTSFFKLNQEQFIADVEAMLRQERKNKERMFKKLIEFGFECVLEVAPQK